nr:crosslink repair DNA glycosylase YcaQ family protein [Phaeobacter marinintestinus]
MSQPVLDNRAARRLFMDRHALLEPPSGAARGAELLDLITRLGFVQLDSINTVARAHDLILFSRRPSYRGKHLKALYEADQALFEHWTHDAAVIPMVFYPHWRLRFQRDAELLKARWKNWRRDGFEEQFKSVLDHIRDHGPAGSSDVGKGERRGSGGWWDWHPSKTALEFLWRSGALTVIGRDGFQKRYDLTERVIEDALRADHLCPNPQDTIDWLCNGALDRLGFATSGEIAAFWDTVSPAESKAWVADELATGRLIKAGITCADGSVRQVVARPDLDERAAEIASPSGRIRVLSPFDPALRDRARAERLFGFYYRIEVFVPADKRTYGYYVFPLLEGDRLVGRIDMKAHRDCGELRVTALWPEPGVRWSDARTRRLEAELARVARLAGTPDVVFLNGWMRDPKPTA